MCPGAAPLLKLVIRGSHLAETQSSTAPTQVRSRFQFQDVDGDKRAAQAKVERFWCRSTGRSPSRAARALGPSVAAPSPKPGTDRARAAAGCRAAMARRSSEYRRVASVGLLVMNTDEGEQRNAQNRRSQARAGLDGLGEGLRALLAGAELGCAWLRRSTPHFGGLRTGAREGCGWRGRARSGHVSLHHLALPKRALAKPTHYYYHEAACRRSARIAAAKGGHAKASRGHKGGAGGKRSLAANNERAGAARGGCEATMASELTIQEFNLRVCKTFTGLGTGASPTVWRLAKVAWRSA